MQTIWHDEDGRVKAVYDGDTNSTVWQERGYSKAVSDPKKNGPLSQDHVVTVEDGKVTGARLDPLPPTAEQWLARIASRADTEINAGITVTVDGVDYLVATTASARTLIAGAKIRAEEAIAAGTSITRKIPTDKGIKTANETQLVALFDLVESRHQAVMERIEELHAKVADGTIADTDLEEGWPA